MKNKVKTAKANAKAAAAVVDGTVGKLKASTRSSSANKKNKGKAKEGGSNIVYIGHLAHGFYEKEMRKFFGQFGKVVQLKLFRSKSTGNSKGYAFVEFEDAETAAVVGEALDGYFLNEKQLVSHVVPTDKCHTGMFKTKKVVKEEDKEDEKDEEPALDLEDGSEASKKVRQLQAKKHLAMKTKKAARLKELGIDFL
jgi:nucleolar protein 15